MVKPMKLPLKILCANPGCDMTFVPYRPQNIYCSDKCQEAHYNSKNDIAGRMRVLREQRRKQKEL
jgi:hypothetical protein